MTCTESQYSQIEKEALAATWACEKFATYIQGNTITLEMDYKPVVPLLSHQPSDFRFQISHQILPATDEI